MKALRYIATAVLCAVLASCTHTRDFYRQPAPGATHVTTTQFAKKALQHHNAIGVQIVALRDDPSVSMNSKAQLLEGYRKSVCSGQERENALPTASCRQGPSWILDSAVSAFEGVQNAQTEAQIQAAIDELVDQIADLIDLIAGVR